MTDCALSNKAKAYLTEKLNESQNIIRKKKRKMKIVKGLYYSTAVSSIILSAITASTGISLPMVIVTTLPILSAILTGLSIQFNFKGKQEKINKEVIKCNLIKSKLDYVINCNGDLTDEIWGGLLKELATY
jgi:hypothetical protein